MLPSKSLIGMVHVGALPGTPFATKPLSEIESTAVAEARVLADAGFNAIIVENMHDRPYVNAPHGPETTASMTRLVSAVRRAVPTLPLGVQILSFGHREALAVALASDAQFIRVENFAYAHVADEGLLPDAAAGALLRERKRLDADNIKLFCDVKKKHASHAITADISLADEAHGMEFFGADGLIVTGAFTGQPTEPSDIAAAKKATHLPVWVGSGVTPPQLGTLCAHADALIVGSWIKQGGVWNNPIDPARCAEMVKEARRVRGR